MVINKQNAENYKLKPKNVEKQTINAGNLGKTQILGLSPSILVRISKEKWVLKVFSLSQNAPLLSFLRCPQMAVAHLFLSRVSCSNRVKAVFFRCNEKGFSLQRASSALSFLYLIPRLTAASRFSLAAVSLLHCSGYSLPFLIYLHPNWDFSSPFCAFSHVL